MHKVWRRLAIACSALLVAAPAVAASEAGAVLAPALAVTRVSSVCSTPRHITFTLRVSSANPLKLEDLSLLGVLSSSHGSKAFTVSPYVPSWPTDVRFAQTLRAPAHAYSVQWLVVEKGRGTPVLGRGRTEFPAPRCPAVVAVNADSDGGYVITDGWGASARFGPAAERAIYLRGAYSVGEPAVAADGPAWPFVTSASGVVLGPSFWFRPVPPHPHPFVAIAVTSTVRGFWLATSSGGVLRRGDAHQWGGSGQRVQRVPITAIAPLPNDQGYWLVAADGTVYSDGAARPHGSLAGVRLNAPIIAAAATSTGRGYWLVASDGGVFTFGDARFFGSTGGVRMTQRVVGFSPTPTGRGYYMVTSTGRLFHFGDAVSYGSVS